MFFDQLFLAFSCLLTHLGDISFGIKGRGKNGHGQILLLLNLHSRAALALNFAAYLFPPPLSLSLGRILFLAV